MVLAKVYWSIDFPYNHLENCQMSCTVNEIGIFARILLRANNFRILRLREVAIFIEKCSAKKREWNILKALVLAKIGYYYPPGWVIWEIIFPWSEANESSARSERIECAKRTSEPKDNFCLLFVFFVLRYFGSFFIENHDYFS